MKESNKIELRNKSDFYEILNELVNLTKDEFLISDYNYVFMGKEKNEEILVV
jgi:hypothetical protein